MLKRETIAIDAIYVPIKRRATLEQKRVDEIAASILDKGLQAPIRVRADGARFVLVEGLHRLEAAKALHQPMMHSFPELTIGGVLIAPFVIYAGAAVAIFAVLRPFLHLVGFDRAFSSAPIAELSLYVVILALLIVLF
jgi:sulfiredoxin